MADTTINAQSPSTAIKKALLLAAIVSLVFATGGVATAAIEFLLKVHAGLTLHVFWLPVFGLVAVPWVALTYAFSSNWVGLRWPWWKAFLLTGLSLELVSLMVKLTIGWQSIAAQFAAICPLQPLGIEMVALWRHAVTCGIRGWLALFSIVFAAIAAGGSLLFLLQHSGKGPRPKAIQPS